MSPSPVVLSASLSLVFLRHPPPMLEADRLNHTTTTEATGMQTCIPVPISTAIEYLPSTYILTYSIMSCRTVLVPCCISSHLPLQGPTHPSHSSGHAPTPPARPAGPKGDFPTAWPLRSNNSLRPPKTGSLLLVNDSNSNSATGTVPLQSSTEKSRLWHEDLLTIEMPARLARYSSRYGHCMNSTSLLAVRNPPLSGNYFRQIRAAVSRRPACPFLDFACVCK